LSSTNYIYLTFDGDTFSVGLIEAVGIVVTGGLGVTATLSIEHFLSPLHAEIIKLLNPNDSSFEA